MSSSEYRKSFAENFYTVFIIFDSDTIENSKIYNDKTWEIEVCVVVNLKESLGVKVEQIFKLPHAGSRTPVSTLVSSFSVH